MGGIHPHLCTGRYQHRNILEGQNAQQVESLPILIFDLLLQPSHYVLKHTVDSKGMTLTSFHSNTLYSLSECQCEVSADCKLSEFTTPCCIS